MQEYGSLEEEEHAGVRSSLPHSVRESKAPDRSRASRIPDHHHSVGEGDSHRPAIYLPVLHDPHTCEDCYFYSSHVEEELSADTTVCARYHPSSYPSLSSSSSSCSEDEDSNYQDQDECGDSFDQDKKLDPTMSTPPTVLYSTKPSPSSSSLLSTLLPHPLPHTLHTQAAHPTTPFAAGLTCGRHLQLREDENMISRYRSRLEAMTKRYESEVKAREGEAIKREEERLSMEEVVRFVREESLAGRDDLRAVREELEATKKELESSKMELELSRTVLEATKQVLELSKKEQEATIKQRDGLQKEINALEKKNVKVKQDLGMMKKKCETEASLRESAAQAAAEERRAGKEELDAMRKRYDDEVRLKECYLADSDRYQHSSKCLASELRTTKDELLALEMAYGELEARLIAVVDSALGGLKVVGLGITGLEEGVTARALRAMNSRPKVESKPDETSPPLHSLSALPTIQEVSLDDVSSSSLPSPPPSPPLPPPLPPSPAPTPKSSPKQVSKPTPLSLSAHHKRSKSAPLLNLAPGSSSPKPSHSFSASSSSLPTPPLDLHFRPTPAPLTHEELTSHVFVDASPTGIGVVVGTNEGLKWLAYRFVFSLGDGTPNPRVQLVPNGTMNMSWAELVAFEMGVRTVLASATSPTPDPKSGSGKQRVTIRSDNTGVVDAVKSGRWTTKYDLDGILHKALDLCRAPTCASSTPTSTSSSSTDIAIDGPASAATAASTVTAGLDVTIKWISTKVNPADAPSRGTFPSREDMIPPEKRPVIPEWLSGVLVEV